jgi:ribonuclease-3
MTSDQKAAAIGAVETLIQYKFHDTELLWEALQTTKVLLGNARAAVPPDGNRRLAIVGDAAMQLALAEDWYRTSDSRGRSREI